MAKPLGIKLTVDFAFKKPLVPPRMSQRSLVYSMQFWNWNIQSQDYDAATLRQLLPGIEKGIERGEQLGAFKGKIQLLQELLGDRTATPED